MEKVEAKLSLKALIEEEMPELGDISMDADNVQEYGINSVSIIRIIVAAEGKYGIEFTDYELSLDEYSTFGDLAAVVQEKIDNKED